MTATQAPDIEALLQRACSLSSTTGKGTRKHLSSPEFVHIARLIGILDDTERRPDQARWSTRPRLYTLLRSIGALAYMDEFVKNSIFDISLPFNVQTLPDFIQEPEVRCLFLDHQACVLTNARILESSTDEHLHVNGSADDHLLPYQELGSGGFGAVDLVFSRLSTRSYARKRVYRGRDSEATRREQQCLVEEIRVLKHLSYRHLTRIVQSYSDHHYIGYLMEPIADCNLHTYLVRKQIPDTDIVHLRHFFGCLAGAVHYLHSKNVRHRDLKLENVLVRQAQIYVADFGTAMEWSMSRRGTTQDRGVPVTKWYMAPEVDDRVPRNNASDMWSLGLVFLEMLTVVKGQTVSKWKDHLKRKALQARLEPWPCRNINLIHEWMLVLQNYSRRHEGYDDESMALKDNEPLSWIKSLLERRHEDRMTAKTLVTTIVDSMYFRDFACFDCVHDFMDPRYRHSSGDHWARSDLEASRQTIDAEVTAMLGVANSVEQQADEDKERTVVAWLEQSRDHWAGSSLGGDVHFAIPGSFNADTVKPQLRSERIDVAQPSGYEEMPALASSSPFNESTWNGDRQPSAVCHEGGFFVDQDSDSSVDGDTDVGAGLHAIPDGFFPIVQDASSESSEDDVLSDPVDSPMLDVREDDRLPAIAEEAGEQFPMPDPSPRSRKGSIVRFNKNVKVAYVEDDPAEQTIEMLSKERALTLDEPILEENIENMTNSTQLTTQEKREHKLPGQTETLASAQDIAVSSGSRKQLNALVSTMDSEATPLDAALIGKLLEKPPASKHPSKKKPVVKPRPTILLPWHDTSQPPKTELTTLGDVWRAAQTEIQTGHWELTPPQIDFHPALLPRDTQATRSIGNLTSRSRTDARVSSVPMYPEAKGYLEPNHSVSRGSTEPIVPVPAPGGNDLPTKSSRGKLSTGNIERLNKENKERTKPVRREFDDDGFTPASFIEKAWKSAEAADSLATSVVSDATAKKLRGIGLLWNDRSYKYLEHFCRRGNTAAVRRLIDQGCNYGTVLKPRPAPLFNAIEGRSARHNKCVRALIKAGCNVNAAHRGRTALHAAIEQPYFNGYQKLLAMLLAAGADMNKPDTAGEYPLTKLFKGAADATLEEYQRQSLALMLHVNVQSIVDVDVQESISKETALHLAIRRRSAQAVALLVHRKANVNAKNASGTTPLLMAANQWKGRLSDQQERILAFLLTSENLNINAVGGTLRRSALHYAAGAGCATAIDRLLERGADPKLRDKEGNNAYNILKGVQENGAVNEESQVMLDLLAE